MPKVTVAVPHNMTPEQVKEKAEPNYPKDGQ